MLIRTGGVKAMARIEAYGATIRMRVLTLITAAAAMMSSGMKALARPNLSWRRTWAHCVC